MKKVVFYLVGCALLTGCVREVSTEKPIKEAEEGTLFGENLPEVQRVPEVLNVLFDEQTALELEKLTTEDGEVQFPNVKSFSPEGIVWMHRLFPYAGKFEERTRKEGLHRWYVIGYDSATATTKAANGWKHFGGAVEVEFNPKMWVEGSNQFVVEKEMPAARSAAGNSKMPFDDPRLSNQWHYLNTGNVASSVSGCDINVFPVWKRYTTGSPSVIVGVVDGGIDFKHEDLAANMWHNPEKNDDAQYGYNFVRNNYQVTADKHGTHVGGTISAVNNNGIGVAGIAGGNFAVGQEGVKLMSCQIFEGEDQGNGASAIKWSADHGAIISQNSWGYVGATTTPSSLKAAVDYFIKYAGIDENGNQVGPMKGGIVFFAAGNEDTNVSGNDYEPILNVASVGADYRRAYYSNYGEWLDIAAPGGDARKGNQILSTLPNNSYGLSQGTSMACPHVSGVAALIVSRFGGENFTPQELEQRIKESASPITSFNKAYYLGKGLINAYAAIAGKGGAAPDVPSQLTAQTQANNLMVSVQVPQDPDDGVPASIIIYYDTSPFDIISDNLMFGQLYVEDENVGDQFTGTITGLEFTKEYYVAAAAVDFAGNKSALTECIKITTGENNPPVMEALNGTSLTIKSHQSGSLDFNITEKDGHFYRIELEQEKDYFILDTLTLRESPKVRVSGPDTPSGTYQAKLIVMDTYGASSSQSMNITILENHAPKTAATFPDRIFNSQTATTEEINCNDFFTDEDEEELKYQFTIDNKTVINMTAQGGKFYLTPMNYGYANITVTGTDVRSETVEQTFKVLVRDGKNPVDVYPNPVRTNLYIRMGEEANARIRVISASGAIIYAASEHISTFSPIVVDMTGTDAGVYAVIVTVGDAEYKYSIVKL